MTTSKTKDTTTSRSFSSTINRHWNNRKGKAATMKSMGIMGISWNRLLMVTMTFMMFISKLLVVVGRKRRDGHPLSRSVRVINQSGYRIDIFWIHPETNELAESNTNNDGIMFGSETYISSYVGHEFEVQELPSNKTGLCRSSGQSDDCLKIYFTVNNNEDQWFTITKDFEDVIVSDNKSRAMEKAKEALDDCNNMIENKDATTEERIDQLTLCLQQKILNKIDETNQEIEFQATIRKNMSNRLKQYICHNNNQHIRLPVTLKNATTSESVRNVSWTYEPSKSDKKKLKTLIQTTHPIQILFESDYSSIRLVKKFTNKEECNHLIQSIKGSNKLLTDSKIEDVYNITSGLAQKDPTVKEFVTKVNLLLSASIGLHQNYYTSLKKTSPLMEMRINYPQKEYVSSRNPQQSSDCELNPDGTCVASTQALTSDSDAAEVREVNIDPKTIANIFVFCDGPKYDTNKQQSGMLFFPKVGVTIIPNDIVYDALLLIHESPTQLSDTGRKRDADPFIDEYIMCPVIDGIDQEEENDGNLQENPLIIIEDQI